MRRPLRVATVNPHWPAGALAACGVRNPSRLGAAGPLRWPRTVGCGIAYPPSGCRGGAAGVRLPGVWSCKQPPGDTGLRMPWGHAAGARVRAVLAGPGAGEAASRYRPADPARWTCGRKTWPHRRWRTCGAPLGRWLSPARAQSGPALLWARFDPLWGPISWGLAATSHCGPEAGAIPEPLRRSGAGCRCAALARDRGRWPAWREKGQSPGLRAGAVLIRPRAAWRGWVVLEAGPDAWLVRGCSAVTPAVRQCFAGAPHNLGNDELPWDRWAAWLAGAGTALVGAVVVARGQPAGRRCDRARP